MATYNLIELADRGYAVYAKPSHCGVSYDFTFPRKTTMDGHNFPTQKQAELAMVARYKVDMEVARKLLGLHDTFDLAASERGLANLIRQARAFMEAADNYRTAFPSSGERIDTKSARRTRYEALTRFIDTHYDLKRTLNTLNPPTPEVPKTPNRDQYR